MCARFEEGGGGEVEMVRTPSQIFGVRFRRSLLDSTTVPFIPLSRLIISQKTRDCELSFSSFECENDKWILYFVSLNCEDVYASK